MTQEQINSLLDENPSPEARIQYEAKIASFGFVPKVLKKKFQVEEKKPNE